MGERCILIHVDESDSRQTKLLPLSIHPLSILLVLRGSQLTLGREVEYTLYTPVNHSTINAHIHNIHRQFRATN